jgi:hypothetical protein
MQHPTTPLAKACSQRHTALKAALAVVLTGLTLPSLAYVEVVTNAANDLPGYGVTDGKADRTYLSSYAVNQLAASSQAPTLSYRSATQIGAKSSASANLATGQLKAYAQSFGTVNEGIYFYNHADARAAFSDELSFQGAIADDAIGTLYVRFHGTTDGDNHLDPVRGSGTLLTPYTQAILSVMGVLGGEPPARAPSSFKLIHQLNEAGCEQASTSVTSCTNGLFEDQVYELKFSLSSVNKLYLSANLVVRTEGEALANFANTASFGLSLPEGVSFKSASGVFLSQASAVPEPASKALLIAGLLVMARVIQRRP